MTPTGRGRDIPWWLRVREALGLSACDTETGEPRPLRCTRPGLQENMTVAVRPKGWPPLFYSSFRLNYPNMIDRTLEICYNKSTNS